MKWVLALGLCLAIAGCAKGETPSLFASDDETCKSRGMRPGTQQYVQCRKLLEAEAEANSARAQAQSQADMARAQADAARAHCIGANPTNPGGGF
jgi:hypothetical protein